MKFYNLSREGLTFFRINYRTNFLWWKKVTWSFAGCFFFRTRAKTLSLISYSCLFWSSNLKLSISWGKRVMTMGKQKCESCLSKRQAGIQAFSYPVGTVNQKIQARQRKESFPTYPKHYCWVCKNRPDLVLSVMLWVSRLVHLLWPLTAGGTGSEVFFVTFASFPKVVFALS